MTTDRTVTPADIDAYNARRARLRAKGIADIPDLYGQDEVGGRFDPTGLFGFWRRHASETAEDIAAARAASDDSGI